MRRWLSSRGGVKLRPPIAVGFCLLATVSILGFCLGRLTFDDPFVTYRYARNVSQGYGLVYNVGERVLSTTAPLYALLLAVGALFTDNLPALSNALSIVAIFVGGWFLYLLCQRLGQARAGVAAALFFATSPLLWLSLGFETGFYLALVIAAFYFYSTSRLTVTAALLGLALLMRGDGIIPALVLGLHYAVTQRRIPWSALAVYVVVAAPLLLYLTLAYGSPLPVTLAAKSAQAKLGVTGFYAHTSFLQGALILGQAYVEQSRLYLLFIPCALAGLAVLFKRQKPCGLIVLWAALYFGGYLLLGVAPYHWYYVPLIPAFAVLTACGLTAAIRRISMWRGLSEQRSTAATIVLLVLLLVPQFVSNARICQALLHPGSMSPEAKTYKVLPEAKVEVYRQVGEWLKAHTPEDAVVGVTEVGVIGYYAGRTMVDFLGLLRPEVAQALRSGNVNWALLHYQPDYVVLTRVNPLYSYDIRADQWFKLAYEPVQVFDDTRFWGGPVTVYQRQTPRYTPWSNTELPAEALPLHVRFADSLELLAYTVDKDTLNPGDILNITLYWRCLAPVPEDYAVFVHVLGQHDLIAAQQDSYPCLGGCPTRGWNPGDNFADPHMIALPVTAFAPENAQLEVGLYERTSQRRLIATTDQGLVLGDNVRFHTLRIVPAGDGRVPNAMQIDFDHQIVLVGYDLDKRLAAPGETFHLTLYWRALQPLQKDYSVFTHLLSQEGKRVAQMDGWPQRGDAPTSGWKQNTLMEDSYDLTVPLDAPSGVYGIDVGLYLAQTGQRLSVLDTGGQPQGDHVALVLVRVAK